MIYLTVFFVLFLMVYITLRGRSHTVKNGSPPKTTLKNCFYIPHLEYLLLWFLQNDALIKVVISPAVKYLFQEGYRPESTQGNDPKRLEEESKENNENLDIQIIERWVVIRIWLDLIISRNISEKQNISFEQSLKLQIDLLDKYSTQTLISAGEIISKYDIDPMLKDLDKELEKIQASEREDFKQNYLADTLTAAEIRILAWIYKELFNKLYKISQS